MKESLRVPINLCGDGQTDFLVLSIERYESKPEHVERIKMERGLLGTFLAEHCCYVTREAIIRHLEENTQRWQIWEDRFSSEFKKDIE